MKSPSDPDEFGLPARRRWGWPMLMFVAGLVLGFVLGVVATIGALIVVQAAISYAQPVG